MRTTLPAIGALLVAATLAAASAAAAQDEWTRQVDAQFEQFAPGMQQRGLSGRGARRYGSLADDGSERFAVSAESTPTLFVGFCDNDCSDLDLLLLDGSGAVVDSDTLDDDYPVVAAPQPGSYTLEVRMKDCSAAPCRYGVQAYSR